MIHPFGRPEYINFLKPILFMARDSSSGFRQGYHTFLYGHKKYNRGSERKRTNERTIWTSVSSKRKKGSFVTLHSLCICRLTLACILRETFTSYLECQLMFDRLPHCLWTLSHADMSPLLSVVDCLSASLFANCPLWVPLPTHPLWVPLPTLLVSLGPHFPLTSGLVGDLESKPFVWFRAKTDKGIVCLANYPHSVTVLLFYCPKDVNTWYILRVVVPIRPAYWLRALTALDWTQL